MNVVGLNVAILVKIAIDLGNWIGWIQGIDFHEGDISVSLVLGPDHCQPLDIGLEVDSEVHVGGGDRAIDCEVASAESDHSRIYCA